MKVLFIVPYPWGEAPSQRFRFEQYFDVLKREGYILRIASFLSPGVWKIFYKKGHFWAKGRGIVKGFFNRFLLLHTVPQYDRVFIHREATPVGPPIIEWIIAKIFRKKIIYDFDDAIWLSNTSKENKVASKFKWHQKTGWICRWSHRVSCGNDFLANYAKRYNQKVVLNPTTIDTDYFQGLSSQNPDDQTVTIGWTGTHSTLEYLHALLPIITQLEKKFNLQFLVISNQSPEFDLDSFQFLPWNKKTEISDLQKIDIGVMPLENDQWAQGKCGLKALQFMAMGIPVLVSPVGVNTEIVKDGENGYLCLNQKDWFNNLEKLIQNENLRKELGKNGRKKVVRDYSKDANSDNFLSLFA